MNLTGPLVLLLAALLAAAQPKTRRCVPHPPPRGRVALLALVYAAGAMAAMYITYTPVGMVRIVGLQARYFLCVWLALLPALAVLLRKTIRPAITEEKAEAVITPAVRLLCRFWRCAALPALLCGAGVRRIRVSWLTRI